MDNSWKSRQRNQGFSAFLLFVDSMSQFIFTRALKKKDTREVTAAMRYIVDESGRHPNLLTVDAGLFFFGYICIHNFYVSLFQARSLFRTSFHSTLRVLVHSYILRNKHIKQWKLKIVENLLKNV